MPTSTQPSMQLSQQGSHRRNRSISTRIADDLLGTPQHVATASSEFAMAVTNGTGVIAHVLLNNILIAYAIPIVMGTVIRAR